MRTSSVFSWLALLLLLVGCTQPAATGQPARDWPVSTPAEQGMDPALLEKMLAQIGETGLALHGLLVIRHGAIVLEQYYPGHSRDEKHALYSVTKSFVATLFGIAMAQGKLEGPGQSLMDFLPGRDFAHPDPRKDALKLEDLLSMTSGLDWQEGDPAYLAMYRSTDWVDWVMDLPVVATPGEVFNYCSGCSHVLLHVIEQATGVDGVDFARQTLFEPLGIRDFEWERTPQDDPIGGWGLSLTARDMARLGYLYLHDGVWEDQRVVPQAWVQAATQMHADPAGRLGYGYQWWLYDTHGAYAALGRGGQTIFVIPDLDVIVVTTADLAGHEPIFALIDDYIIPAVEP